MSDRSGLNDEAENGTTQDRADAETAQPAPTGHCRYCKKEKPLRRVAEDVRDLAEEAATDGSRRPLLGCDDCLAIVERGLATYVTDQPEPVAASATALQTMRDALGVDVITGLDLADAVRVGMVLGQLLASDGDTRLPADDLTDLEHDTLKHAVQDLLNRRRGVDPDLERTLLAFGWGSMSAWSLAMELDMSAQDIARTATGAADRGVFSGPERDRLLDLLEDIVNVRMGLASTEASV